MRKYSCDSCKRKLGRLAFIGPRASVYCPLCWKIRNNVFKILFLIVVIVLIIVKRETLIQLIKELL